MRRAAILFPALLLVAMSDDVSLPNADCTFVPQQMHRSGRAVWRELSQRAEAVAPSSGRRRAVVPPNVPAFTPRNFIDNEIFGKMLKDGVRWTSRSSDTEFLRRVTLDLTGELPDADTVKAFIADPASDKRDKAIDRLLASDAFVDRWTMWFGDLVQNVQSSATTIEYSQGRNAYYKFIHDSIRDGKPYDQMVREIIAGNGRAFSTGEVNHFVRDIANNGPIQDTYDNLSASTGEHFLGLPLMCLSCHNGIGHLEIVNSALSKRTRYDFWKNAAFFAQVTSTREKDPASNAQETILADNQTGAYRLNTTSGNKTPRAPVNNLTTVDPSFFLNGEIPRDGEPRRTAYGRILTAHPQFARATVNYLWKELFGLGIVEPADSFDLLRQDPATLPAGATLQPTHPALLNELALSFQASGYSLRLMLKTIVISNAYQLASRYDGGAWNETYVPYFARHIPRRLMAEETLDAVFKSTGVGAQIGVAGSTAVPKAMMLPDTSEGGAYRVFLNNFGRGNRDDQQRSSEGSAVQALTLLDDRIITDRIKSTASGSTLQKLLASTKDPGAITDALYLATLSRYPNGAERSQAIGYLQSGDVAKKSEDLLYSLLNRLEFLFN